MNKSSLNRTRVFNEVTAVGGKVVVLETGLLGLGLLWRRRREIVKRRLWWLESLLVLVEIVEGLVELVLLRSLRILLS